MPSDPEKHHMALRKHMGKIEEEGEDKVFEGMTLELDLRVKSNLKLHPLIRKGHQSLST